jgi:hypothetical protein
MVTTSVKIIGYMRLHFWKIGVSWNFGCQLSMLAAGASALRPYVEAGVCGSHVATCNRSTRSNQIGNNPRTMKLGSLDERIILEDFCYKMLSSNCMQFLANQKSLLSEK